MKNTTLLFTLLSVILFTNCNSDYKFALEAPKKAALNSEITITLKEESNQQIDKVEFYINGKKQPAQSSTFTLNTSDLGLGKHSISALAFYPGKTKKINNTHLGTSCS